MWKEHKHAILTCDICIITSINNKPSFLSTAQAEWYQSQPSLYTIWQMGYFNQVEGKGFFVWFVFSLPLKPEEKKNKL